MEGTKRKTRRYSQLARTSRDASLQAWHSQEQSKAGWQGRVTAGDCTTSEARKKGRRCREGPAAVRSPTTSNHQAAHGVHVRALCRWFGGTRHSCLAGDAFTVVIVGFGSVSDLHKPALNCTIGTALHCRVKVSGAIQSKCTPDRQTHRDVPRWNETSMEPAQGRVALVAACWRWGACQLWCWGGAGARPGGDHRGRDLFRWRCVFPACPGRSAGARQLGLLHSVWSTRSRAARPRRRAQACSRGLVDLFVGAIWCASSEGHCMAARPCARAAADCIVARLL